MHDLAGLLVLVPSSLTPSYLHHLPVGDPIPHLLTLDRPRGQELGAANGGPSGDVGDRV
jgi:hypothetical protein